MVLYTNTVFHQVFWRPKTSSFFLGNDFIMKIINKLSSLRSQGVKLRNQFCNMGESRLWSWWKCYCTCFVALEQGIVINPLKAKFWKLINFTPKLFTSWLMLYKSKRSQNFEFLYFGPRNIRWQLNLSMADSRVKK